MADEVIFVAGPVLVTLLATEVSPASGIAVAAATCVAGTLLFAAQRATEPPAHPAGPEPLAGGEPLAGPRPGTRSRSGRRLLPAPGMVTLAPVYFFFGAMLAAIDVSTVDFAAGHGHKPFAGVILGGYALGSAAGGLWYGARTWHSSHREAWPGSPQPSRSAPQQAPQSPGSSSTATAPGGYVLAADCAAGAVLACLAGLTRLTAGPRHLPAPVPGGSENPG